MMQSNGNDGKRFGTHRQAPASSRPYTRPPHAGQARPHTAGSTTHAPSHIGGRKPFTKHSGGRGGFSRGKGRPMEKRGPMRKVISEAATKREHVIPPLAEGVVRVIPLGGVEEVGRNMTAIEYGNEIFVVDAGIQFKTEDTPGIDFILPNTKYLEANKHKIVGLGITHGHLDHIGAIPFVMDMIGNPTIYACEFGAIMIKKRQEEFPHVSPLNIKICDTKTGFLPISPNFKIKFFGVTHSIPDSSGIIIETPIGNIVATGDIRLDSVDGIPTDEEKEQYAWFKDKDNLLLMLDSTNVEKTGWSVNEEEVIKRVDEIVKNVSGRIIIATFASQVERLISFITIAQKHGKKIVVEGRSMKNNIDIIKFLKLADTSHIIPIEEMQNHPPHKLMILSTGGQGEEFSALSRIANGTHKFIRLVKSDTIILSSSVIPGNERSVATLKDNLYHHDARIITTNDDVVHSSGHGKRGELEWVQKNIPHRFFMPVHGHHYMRKINAEVSRSAGKKDHEIVVPDNGGIVEIYDQGTKIRILKEKAPSGIIMVDGFSIGDVQEVVIRDRQALAQDGMFVIITSIDVNTGRLRKSPDIISRGFIYLKDSQDLLHEARNIIKKTIEEGAVGNPINFDLLKDTITDNVSRYLFQQTAKKPMVIPVVIGV